ncbi:hypothetical protein HOLDEFILI_03619 [Holdemania filiformis DSM 12042]|uniref:Uncharacterized protein n=1 Tax=Holdemania filiformis DSM 12042 TaxID=545696 RepID=B9YCQ7_9FIRM|nr:hypothetical protein HOLDEFILI_03619 [Holdemania filiformis DSM 12042]
MRKNAYRSFFLFCFPFYRNVKKKANQKSAKRHEKEFQQTVFHAKIIQ